MRKISWLVLLVFLFVLSGCVQMQHQTKLNEDGSGTISLKAGVKLEALEEGAEDFEIDEAEKEKFENAGFTVTTFEEDGYKGIIISKPFESAASYNAVIQQLYSELGDEEGAPSLDGIKMKASEENVLELSGTIPGDAASALMNPFFDVTFAVEAGGEVISHNASSVDGNAYVWRVDLGEDLSIQFKMKGSGTSGLSPTVTAGIVAVLVLIGAVVFFLRYRFR